MAAPVWPRPAAPAHVRRAGPASPLGPAGSRGAAAHRPSWSPGPPPALQGTLLALRNRAGGLRARIQTPPASSPPARCISCPQRPGSTRWPAWSEPMMVDRGAAMPRLGPSPPRTRHAGPAARAGGRPGGGGRCCPAAAAGRAGPPAASAALSPLPICIVRAERGSFRVVGVKYIKSVVFLLHQWREAGHGSGK